jgi:hypothetical protein
MLEEMKLKDIMNVVNSLESNNKPVKCFWKAGEKYFIRTVTMHIIGTLLDIEGSELLLKNAVWVADSGRFYNALKTGQLEEVEPFVNDVIINRGSIVDATVWNHEIPKEPK